MTFKGFKDPELSRMTMFNTAWIPYNVIIVSLFVC